MPKVTATGRWADRVGGWVTRLEWSTAPVRDDRRARRDKFPEMIKKEEQGVYSKPYSTAMRHASLAFLLAEACCLRLCEEEKSSSQAGQECALSVDRGALRGV